jgi:hypothetical protein
MRLFQFAIGLYNAWQVGVKFRTILKCAGTTPANKPILSR